MAALTTNKRHSQRSAPVCQPPPAAAPAPVAPSRWQCRAGQPRPAPAAGQRSLGRTHARRPDVPPHGCPPARTPGEQGTRAQLALAQQWKALLRQVQAELRRQDLPGNPCRAERCHWVQAGWMVRSRQHCQLHHHPAPWAGPAPCLAVPVVCLSLLQHRAVQMVQEELLQAVQLLHCQHHCLHPTSRRHQSWRRNASP